MREIVPGNATHKSCGTWRVVEPGTDIDGLRSSSVPREISERLAGIPR